MSRVMGIDLGTTNSVVAIWETDSAQVVINAEGAKTTPSVVFYAPGGECVVGELAKRQEIINPERTVRSIKRFMGCRWEESEAKRGGISYPLRPNAAGMVTVEIDGREITPEEISSEILRKMRQSAEAHVGETIEHAVITVPAYFNDTQRSATKAAAELAGLTVLRIINEPTAAALAYGLGREDTERVAVFDFGGGTFDITLLEIEGDVFEVRATSGDNFLGGDNLDEALTQWICDRIVEEHGVDPRADVQAHQRIRDAAEKIKCELSTLSETTLNLPFIVADESGPKHFVQQIARTQFEEIVNPLLDRIEGPCKQVLRDANIIPADIDTVLLVGGSTRIPRVREIAENLFGREPNRTVNPDEVVALGASIQASILSGDIEEVLLLDVTPLSLGIELEGGVMKTLIPRNSSIPTTASRTFTTTRDNQRAVSISVLQGERKIAKENREMARFRLTAIRPAPREVPEIEVTFHIDANGILNVSAEDLSTAVRQEITVESIAALAPEEIERMIKDSEVHAREDAEFTQAVQAREQAILLRDKVESFIDLRIGDIGPEEERDIRETLLQFDLAVESNDMIGLFEARQAMTSFVQSHSDLFYLHTVSKPESSVASAPKQPSAETPPAEEAEVEAIPEDEPAGN